MHPFHSDGNTTRERKGNYRHAIEMRTNQLRKRLDAPTEDTFLRRQCPVAVAVKAEIATKTTAATTTTTIIIVVAGVAWS